MPTTAMFWRIVRRLLTANYARLFVILLALGAGAAVTSALLNLQIDAKRRLTTEFRALGANVIVAPRDSDTDGNGATLDEAMLGQLPAHHEGKPVPAVAFLYVIVEVAKAGEIHFEPAVIAGTQGLGLTEIRPGRRSEYLASLEKDPAACEVGAKAATQFAVHPGDSLQLRNEGRTASCKVFAVVATGGSGGQPDFHASRHRAVTCESARPHQLDSAQRDGYARFIEPLHRPSRPEPSWR